MNRRQFCAAVCASLGTGRAFGETIREAPAGAELAAEAIMNLSNATVGGKQFWADRCFFHEWRIQRHALTGHCRLLDGKDIRHTWGSYEACREKLDEIRRRDNLPPMQGKAVIVLHGLFRSRSSMERLRTALAAANGYTVFCMGYPTTRGSVSDHADSLNSVIASLEGITEINFVAHSLGNLVVRHWLNDFVHQQRTLPAGQTFGRMVMLAPPNRRPELATKLVRGEVAKFVAGPAAQQLAEGWSKLEPKLATPHFEFGILAGGKGDNRGFNPLIPGDDDAVVTVDSTRLPQARDFRLLPVLHSFFMNDSRVHEMTRQFLTHGYFESEASRQPISTV
jgi:hypothetical protein